MSISNDPMNNASTLSLISVGFVLRFEFEVFVRRPKEHFSVDQRISTEKDCKSLDGERKKERKDLRDLDPVLVVITSQESFQIAPASPSWGSVLDIRRKILEYPNRYITIGEAQPFKQEASSCPDSMLIGAPHF